MSKLNKINQNRRREANRTLARCRTRGATQVVVWWLDEDGVTGVEISDGVDRVKAIGAIEVAKQEVWDA